MKREKRKTGLEKGAKMRSAEDSLGSYTGICADGGERPDQDADDL